MKSSNELNPICSVEFPFVERLRESPAGINTCKSAHAPDRLIRVVASHPASIRSERSPNALEEHGVVRSRFRSAAEGSDAFDHVRMARGPLKRLLGAHRPSRNECHASNTEFLGNQPVLRGNVVLDRDGRKVHPI